MSDQYVITASDISLHSKAGHNEGGEGSHISFNPDEPIEFNHFHAKFNEGVRTEKISSKDGTEFINYSNNKVNFSQPVDFGNNLVELNNVELHSGQIQSNNSEYNTIDDEIDDIHNSVNANTNRTSNYTASANKIVHIGGNGSITTSSLLSNQTPQKNLTNTFTDTNTFDGDLVATTYKVKSGGSTVLLDFFHLNGGAAIGQIPDLPASKIASGTLSSDRIPSLDTSKITSGRFTDDRLPTNIVRTDVADQTITSKLLIDGGTGDSVLTLKADSDNANEGDNAFIKMIQDGGAEGSGGTRFTVGLDGNNDLFMGCDSNSSFFGGLVLQTNGSGIGSNQKPIIFKPQLQEAARITQFGISLASGKNYYINGSQIDFDDLANSGSVDSARLTNEISPTIIPNLDAAKISTGELGVDRIPTLTIGKIPDLTADKIASGELAVARIPILTADKIPNLSADKITTDELGIDRIPTLTTAKIPNLSANKITSDELGVARIPNLPASKINSGELGLDRIPTLTNAKLPTNLLRDDIASQTISNTTANTELNIKVRSDVSTYNPVVKLSKHNNNDVLQEQLTMTLTDTALESNTDTAYIYKVGTAEKLRISGSSVKVNDTLNINDKIQLAGSNPGSNSVIQVGTDGTASFTAISGLAATTNADDLTSGTLDAALLPNIPDSKLPTNIVRDDVDNQVISCETFTLSSGTSNDCEFIIQSNTDNNSGGEGDNPLITLKQDGGTTRGKIGLQETNNALFIKTESNSGAANNPIIFRIETTEVGRLITTGFNLASGKTYRINNQQIDFDDLANSGSVDSARLTGTISNDRIPTLTADKLPTTIEVDRINFNQASSGTDSTSLPKIFDLDDSLFFETPALKKFRFTIGGSGAGEIISTGLHDFPNCDIASGGQYKIDGTQIDFDDLANSGSVDSARLTGTIDINRIPSITNDKLPDAIECETVEVSRIKFNSSSNSTDSTTSPSIHDFNDSLIFDVLSGERYSFKVNNTIVGELNASGWSQLGEVGLASGGQYKVGGSQISTTNLADNTSIVKTSGNQNIAGEKTFTDDSTFEKIIQSELGQTTGSSGLQLTSGRAGTSTTDVRQISMGYNGTNQYQHHIATNHDSGTLTNNKMEFYVNNGVASSSLPTTGCRRAFSLFPTSDGGSTAKVYGKSECDSIETTVGQAKFKQPFIANDFALECANIHIRNDMGYNSATSSGLLKIDGSIDYKGYTTAGSWHRMMCGMSLGEDFIDTTKVLKMRVAIYRLGPISTTPEYFLTVNQRGGSISGVTGLNGSNIGDAYTGNPTPIIINHSTTDTFNTSHNKAAIHGITYGSGTTNPFGSSINSGINSCLTGRGYLYKKATGTNPFDTAVKNASRTLWLVGTRTDDDFKISINGEVIQMYEYANTTNTSNNALYYKYSIFEMIGDWALIEYKNMNGSGGAYVNLVFQCLGTN